MDDRKYYLHRYDIIYPASIPLIRWHIFRRFSHNIFKGMPSVFIVRDKTVFTRIVWVDWWQKLYYYCKNVKTKLFNWYWVIFHYWITAVKISHQKLSTTFMFISIIDDTKTIILRHQAAKSWKLLQTTQELIFHFKSPRWRKRKRRKTWFGQDWSDRKMIVISWSITQRPVSSVWIFPCTPHHALLRGQNWVQFSYRS